MKKVICVGIHNNTYHFELYHLYEYVDDAHYRHIYYDKSINGSDGVSFVHDLANRFFVDIVEFRNNKINDILT